MKAFYLFFSLPALALSAFLPPPIASAHDCGAYLKKHIPSEGTQYLTGIIVTLQNGKKDYVYGSIFDSHESLLQYANAHDGKVSSINWAGEMRAGNGIIQAVNETAGLMSEKKYPLEKLQVSTKSSDYETVREFFNEHSRLKKLIHAETTFTRFNPDPNLPKSENHLTPELTSLSEFRHELDGLTHNFKAFDRLLILKQNHAALIHQYLQKTRILAEELLFLCSLFEKFNYHTEYTDGTPNIGSEEILKLKGIATRIQKNTWIDSPEVREQDLAYFYFFAKTLKQGSGMIGSIPLD